VRPQIDGARPDGPVEVQLSLEPLFDPKRERILA
jgi:hypothetical protein